jgi:poly-gamma-glutamate synthesis protein (capsule biosynthesis protein)
VFGAEPACINGIKKAGVSVLCLANNHILDHGGQGLLTTISACERAGIETVGGGPNLASARQPLIKSLRGKRIGIVAMAEHEFSIAGSATPGANPIDLIEYVRTMADLRGQVDYAIVLLHGGPEFLTVPSPNLRKTCRFLIEMGANAVIVQHPHSLGGYESYLNGHIVYGQGALVMDEELYSKRVEFHEGLLVGLTIEEDGPSTMDLIPFVQSSPALGAHLMDEAKARMLLTALEAKSSAILDDDYLAREWKRYCVEQTHGYLSVVLAHNRIVRRVNRQGLLGGLLYSRKRLLGTQNVIRCETHREILDTIFEEFRQAR